MNLKEELAQVQSLRAELDALRPLSPEVEARVMQKLRLDWNYHSAKIEGGELTFGETKALLFFGITAGQKPLKDHIEMKGHNEAIHFLTDLARQKEPLTEYTIRGLHKIILGDNPFRSEARSADGQQTSRWITPGRYKQEPNHVETATGEMFRFASPEETPAKMQELVAWYRAEEEKQERSPVLLAAEFHYRFVRIHPFDDGNGRMARLLMNFILMRHGFPPAVIHSETRNEYFRVLQAADAGEFEPFFTFVAHEIARSLGIMVRAAKGEDIEERDDIFKEIALLEKRLKSEEEAQGKIGRSTEAIEKIFCNTLVPLFENIVKELTELDRFFSGKMIQVYYNSRAKNIGSNFWISHKDGKIQIVESNSYEYQPVGEKNISIEVGKDLSAWFSGKSYGFGFTFAYVWRDFLKKGGKSPVDNDLKIIVNFDFYQYIIGIEGTAYRVEKEYDTYLSKQEQEDIVHIALKTAFDRVKQLFPPDPEEAK